MRGISGNLLPPGSTREAIEKINTYSKNGHYASTVSKHLEWIVSSFRRYPLEFQFAHTTLRRASNVTDIEAKHLKSLYRSSSFEEHNSIRAAGSLVSCPYCGITNGLTVDHYLPKNDTDFPHLSAFPLNLVPSCSGCQSEKGTSHPTREVRHALFSKQWTPRRTRAVSASGRAMGGKYRIVNANRIFHPYIDDIDAKKIKMSFQVDPIAGPHSPRLTYGDGRMTRDAQLFRNHLRKLDVERRIQPVIQHEWVNLPRTLRLYGTSSRPSDISLEVQKLGIYHDSTKGTGSVQAVFFRALSQNSACMEMLSLKLNEPRPSLSTTR